MRKEIIKIFAVAFFAHGLLTAQSPTQLLSPHTEAKIDSIIKLMTIDEKLGQLNQIGGTWYDTKTERLNEEQTALLKAGSIGSFLGINGAAETGRIQRIAMEETRMKIPVMFGADIIHGFRTITPIPLAEASSWNPELVERSARIAAIEGAAAGVHWNYAPMVDIARDPRWGRIAEGSGEDVFLGSAMAAARVKGFQGKNLLEYGSLLACAKHFAAYGGAEAGRDYNTVDMSERSLREIYFPPYKAAIDAGAWTLMSAFNEIGGVPSSGSHWLMTDLLRKEWGFKGLVVSDYTAIMELLNHRIAKDSTEAGIVGLSAGVDIDMVSRIYIYKLAEAVRSGKLSEEIVNEAVRRVLRVKFAYGLFNDPYRNAKPEKEKELLLHKDHRAVAREIARQSIVLLKNEKSILPLSTSTKKIALIGPLAGKEHRRDLAGAWAWVQNPDDVVSVIEGIASKLSSQTKVLYDKGCEIESDSGSRISQAVKLAKQSDVVIAVLGESQHVSGEAASKTDLDLPFMQKELLKALHKTGKPIVLVVMNGRPLTLQWEADNIPAIVEAWHLGVETGNALADVLFGDYNPSGKLPVTFPRSVGQIPIYYNHKSTGRPMVEKDKYTSRYLDSPNSPLYPFGFGLSYTTFSYSNVKVSSSSIKKDQKINVSVDIGNSGKRSGEEVVQLYIRDDVATVTRPVKELKGFKKISLNTGEKKTVEFTLMPDDLSFYNLDMKKVVEPGTFTVFVGGNSADYIETKFEVVE
ncbi:MAG: glycoside hydrolase family 3 C-terminal domain-containing protein [Ignavibacteriales bacterium]|nr:glycoside hydrolase family 3 C-terminal domain-containing protein [Ignavibacteriales bacterium]